MIMDKYSFGIRMKILKNFAHFGEVNSSMIQIHRQIYSSKAGKKHNDTIFQVSYTDEMILRNVNNLNNLVLWDVLLTPSSRLWDIMMLYLLDFQHEIEYE